jgi:RNA polymerase sigma-70 factor, ECF subfamily
LDLAGQGEYRKRIANLPEAPAEPGGDPDLSLVRRAREGSFEAFDTLVGRHERYLYTLALRIVRNVQDAEEVVQETFLSVVEHIKDFAEQSTFRTWLVRIATNHALKVLRRRRTHRAIQMSGPDPDERRPLPHPQFIAPWRDEPLNLAQEKETQRLLVEAMEAIDDKYRLVFQLRDVQGLSTEETARALAITESNVKVRLLRARLMLRERLTLALGDRDRQVTPHHREEPTTPKVKR